MNPLIRFERAALGFRRRIILQDLDFTIETGDLIGIVGPNGSGKSTLLRALLGLIEPLSGRIHRATPLPRMGYVPQRAALDEHYPLTVEDIVLMGRFPHIRRFRGAGAFDRVKTGEALAHLGMDHLSAMPYARLSGGQKQRVLLARAIVSDPQLLVLDEPTEGLDIASEEAILDLIGHFHVSHGLTVVMVSHELVAVQRLCRRIGLVHNGRLELGAATEILRAERLREIFQTPESKQTWTVATGGPAGRL